MQQAFARRDHRIDVLRGLAISVVLMHHFYLAYAFTRTPAITASARLIRAVGRNGNYGVIVFFVISGYLITSTSLRRFGSLPNISARVFYTFRFARIFPCLVLILSIVTAAGTAGVPYFRNEHNVSFLVADLSVLTFWHNVLMAKAGWFNYCLNVLWSLSVEEVFYLAFPLLWLSLRKTRFVVAVWMAAIVIGPLYRSYHRTDDLEYLCSYWACFDAIAMGCLTALLAKRVAVPQKTRNIVQTCAGVVMIWLYLHASIHSDAVAGPSVMAACTAVILLVEGAAATETTVRSNLGAAAVGWLGRHSYELYLFHIVVLATMRDALPAAESTMLKAAYFVLFIGVSIAVASAISRLYSEPLNGWIRERLIRRSKPAGVSSRAA
jgi:peptidoglycan/LPS O-acetylase OafA/YrhL